MIDIRIEPSLEPPEYNVPECPVCHESCGIYYRNINREIIACENCITIDTEYEDTFDAWNCVGNNNNWRLL